MKMKLKRSSVLQLTSVLTAIFLLSSCNQPLARAESKIAGQGDFIQQEVTPQIQIKAAHGIIGRITPQIADKFILQIIPSENGLDVFEIASQDGKVVLRGSTGVALASAYNWYLKHYCNCHVSWCGDQLNVPDPLPTLKNTIRMKCPHKYRVYFNYCTLSYSAPWWDWQRWQREIDFMAMNGINMPLSVIGLEGIWYNTLLKFGFTDKQARAYLVGPDYFAWQWMTNIQSHGGPLPLSWIKSHIKLGQKILQRQRALGMIPVQQGFSGCVPALMTRKFPHANIAQKRGWCGFPGTFQLDPLDPLFDKFGKAFLKEEIRLFGTSHIYAADPFHEGSPPRPGADYLRKVGKAIYNLMVSVDPQGLWAMQAWSIRKDIACAVPKNKLLILDLSGGKWRSTKNFWGYNFIRGQLHNFGGRINLHGDLNYLAANPFAKIEHKLPNVVGTGLFMEGIIQNPVFYDLYFDVLWRNDPVNIHKWLKEYARRRYGVQSANADKAWEILLANPYRRGTNGVESSSIIAARPALDVKKSGPNAGFNIPYKPVELVKALQLLLKDSRKLGKSDAYHYDVVDITRQVLSNLGQVIQKRATTAFRQKNMEQFKINAQNFLNLLHDVDTLLASRSEFSFGKWINDARKWGTTEKEKSQYEWDASMLVTIWGPEKNPRIFDYSWREWSGLIDTYYLHRWGLFYGFLYNKLKAGQDYKDPHKLVYGREAFRANKFYNRLADWELQWCHTHHKLTSQPQGDAIKLARTILTKYMPIINSAYGQEKAHSNQTNNANPRKPG